MKPSSFERNVLQSWGENLAVAEFRNDPKKAKIAAEAFSLGLDYVHSQPIGWNRNDTQDTFRRECGSYILANLKAKPSGFFALPLFGWLFSQLISSLVSWAVKKLIEVYFPDR